MVLYRAGYHLTHSHLDGLQSGDGVSKTKELTNKKIHGVINSHFYWSSESDVNSTNPLSQYLFSNQPNNQPLMAVVVQFLENIFLVQILFLISNTSNNHNAQPPTLLLFVDVSQWLQIKIIFVTYTVQHVVKCFCPSCGQAADVATPFQCLVLA